MFRKWVGRAALFGALVGGAWLASQAFAADDKPLDIPVIAGGVEAGSTATRYPIVLVHGFMGFKEILGVDYFYEVPELLRKNGAKVYVAAVSEVNSSSVRGEQLLQQMKQWAAKDGIKKFNLLGHSQGGPTARYVAGVAPDLVASVTTMAS